MIKLLWVCTLVILLNTPTTGQSFRTFYEHDTLYTVWKPYYDIVFNDIFKNSILPILTQEERDALESVKITCPLFGLKSSLFDFHASPDWGVKMSTLSLRFWGDLALAYSWLSVNNYSQSTIWQYIAMLRHHDFAGEPLPRPLDVLIPNDVDVRADYRVVARAEQIITSTFIFLLGHELGHLYHGLSPLEGNQYTISSLSRKREAQADAFALGLMYRLRLIPIGVEFWFHSVSCWQSDDENTSHPLNKDRIASVADFIKLNAEEFAELQNDPAKAKQQLLSIGKELENLTGGMDGFHETMISMGRNTTVEMLVPRKEVVYTMSGDISSENDKAFIGSYVGVVRSAANPSDPFEIPISFDLNVSDRGGIIGSWTYGNRSGSLTGNIFGDKFYFELNDDIGLIGKGTLSTEDNGKTVKGTIGSGPSMAGAGIISAHRP